MEMNWILVKELNSFLVSLIGEEVRDGETKGSENGQSDIKVK